MTEEKNQSAADSQPGAAPPSGNAAKLVAVRMFDKIYEIKSDKPQLAEQLADDIDREARRLRELNPSLGPGHFDWPVQVAFQMALGRYNAQRVLNDLKARVENDSEKMAALIDAVIGDSSPD
ncbi:MAG: hypothetical protein LBS31_09615 [Candidatus Adiutrix sp.]|jgi:hypothetical protein|nr:hypothetical protein [Candidatus Adiutrix sp.]